MTVPGFLPGSVFVLLNSFVQTLLPAASVASANVSGRLGIGISIHCVRRAVNAAETRRVKSVILGLLRNGICWLRDPMKEENLLRKRMTDLINRPQRRAPYRSLLTGVLVPWQNPLLATSL